MKERVTWTAIEWRKVVLYLAHRFPEILKGDLSRVKHTDVERAAMAVLASDRKRDIHHTFKDKNGRHIAEAAKYLAALPNLDELLADPRSDIPDDGARTARKTAAKWGDEHWLKYHDALIAKYPEGYSNLTMRQLIDVMSETFPPEMHRRFPSVIHVIGALKNLQVPTAPPPEPEAAPEPEKAPEPDADDDHRTTRWGAADWVRLAEEIHRQNPYYGWPYKEHLAGLTLEECKAAQAAVIPSERRRKFTNITAAREHLIEAFKVVRARIEDEKASLDRELEHERRLSELRLEEERKKVELQLNLAAATAPIEEPLTIKLAQALTPMVKILADEFGKAFAAAIIPAVQAAVSGITLKAPEPEQPAQPRTSAPPLDPLDDQPPPSYVGPEGLDIRPPRIAIIGPSNLGAYLEESFPDIEFTFIEKAPKGVPEAVQHCERIIGIDKFVTQAARHALRSDAAKAKFTQVSGGTSAVKRQIALWLSSGVIRNTRREPAHARLQ